MVVLLQPRRLHLGIQLQTPIEVAKTTDLTAGCGAKVLTRERRYLNLLYYRRNDRLQSHQNPLHAGCAGEPDREGDRRLVCTRGRASGRTGYGGVVAQLDAVHGAHHSSKYCDEVIMQ